MRISDWSSDVCSSDLPRPGDVESEAPAIELVPDVGDLRARPGGREPRADRIAIKAKRAFEAGTFEIAVAVGGHHRPGRLKHQYLQRFVFVEREIGGVAPRPPERLDRHHLTPPVRRSDEGP